MRKALALLMALAVLGTIAPAFAAEQGQLLATQEDGYGRVIVSFPSRETLPKYTMRIENGVLSIQFDDPVDIVLPDVGAVMPDYLSVARVDPDGRGLRMGLRSAFSFNRTEAGERLYIDLLPPEGANAPDALLLPGFGPAVMASSLGKDLTVSPWDVFEFKECAG